MRFVWRLVFASILLSPMAKAETEMRAFKDFDRRIEALESYSVTYKERGQEPVQIKEKKVNKKPKGEKIEVELKLLPKPKRLIARR